MAGKKLSKNRQIDEASKTRFEKVEDPIISISPNGDLRRRLDEASIDIKENIPTQIMSTRRVTRSCSAAMAIEPTSSSPECRKRRSSQVGPAAKRASNEKKSDGSDESSESTCSKSSGTTSSSSHSIKSRSRGSPLPVMEEEDDSFDSNIDPYAPIDFGDVDEDGIVEEDYDDEDEEEDEEENYEDYEDDSDDDDLTAPLQNQQFAVSSLHMNDVTLLEAPKAMNANKLDGIGSPEKVWSLMVGRDEISRASHCLLNNHPDMTQSMRALLLDWLMEVCESENLHRETFHLAIDYVDRYLESNEREITQSTFQLVGAASLFIAAKYEEIYPPRCEDFANLTDGAFDCENIRQMEILIVRAINWSLGPITSVHWLATYLQMLGCDDSIDDGDSHVLEANYFVPDMMREDFVHMAKILDYLLFETDSLRFTYRTIAAAVLFACYEPTSVVEDATGFKYDQLQQVIRFVEPVVTVFDKSRSAGDPLPTNFKISSDDVHNIQTYFKHEDLKEFVEQERLRAPSIFQ